MKIILNEFEKKFTEFVEIEAKKYSSCHSPFLNVSLGLSRLADFALERRFISVDIPPSAFSEDLRRIYLNDAHTDVSFEVFLSPSHSPFLAVFRWRASE